VSEVEAATTSPTLRGTAKLSIEPLATSVRYELRTRRVVVELNKGTTLTVPVDLLQGLARAKPKDLATVEIVSPGVAIEWPTLDQQFSVSGLLAGVFGTKAWMKGLSRREAIKAIQSRGVVRSVRRRWR
jgi:hypothetical protein